MVSQTGRKMNIDKNTSAQQSKKNRFLDIGNEYHGETCKIWAWEEKEKRIQSGDERIWREGRGIKILGIREFREII